MHFFFWSTSIHVHFLFEIICLFYLGFPLVSLCTLFFSFLVSICKSPSLHVIFIVYAIFTWSLSWAPVFSLSIYIYVCYPFFYHFYAAILGLSSLGLISAHFVIFSFVHSLILSNLILAFLFRCDTFCFYVLICCQFLFFSLLTLALSSFDSYRV